MQKKGLFLDLDHNIIRPKSGETFPKDIYDWKLIPNMVPMIFKYQEQGYIPIIVSNQGGIEDGYITEDGVNQKMRNIIDILSEVYDVEIETYYFSTTNEKTDQMRKPNPGMAYEARDHLKIDLSQSIMVGDMESDEQFAINSGIGTFYYTDKFIESLNNKGNE